MSHILLVDDNLDLCYMLSCLLQSHGYTVTIANDAFAAMKEFHKRVPDLILLDLMLPKIDGMEVCWRLRAESDVPIIIISAKNKDVDLHWGLKAGANDYLTKPLNIEQLLSRIEAVLKEHSPSKLP